VVYLSDVLNLQKKQEASSELREVEEWVEPSTKQTAPAQAGRKGSATDGKESKLTMKDLRLGTDDNDNTGVSSEEKKGPRDNGDGGAGTGILGAMKHSARFRTLYERIDSALDYPTELAENRIQGTVTARLVFSADGALEKSRSEVASSSRYLKVLVHRLFRRVFDANAVKQPRWHGSDPLTVFCYFEFRLKNSDIQFDNPTGAVEDRRVFGNKFYFSRYASISGEWAAGPIHGYYAMPAVGIDPDWFVEQMKPKKDKGDPLDSYRRDPEF
jgi:hypothetical protein